MRTWQGTNDSISALCERTGLAAPNGRWLVEVALHSGRWLTEAFVHGISAASVSKTGRLLVSHEAPVTSGMA